MGLILLVSPFIIRVNAEMGDEETRSQNSSYTFDRTLYSFSTFYHSMTQSVLDFISTGSIASNHGLTLYQLWAAGSNHGASAWSFIAWVDYRGVIIRYKENNVSNADTTVVYPIQNITLNTRFYLQIAGNQKELDFVVYEGSQSVYSLTLDGDVLSTLNNYNIDFGKIGYSLPLSYAQINQIIDFNNFPSITPITNIISYPIINQNENNYYYFKELTRVWDDTYNNNEYVDLVSFIDSADNEYIIRLFRPLPAERSVITRDTYLQLYDNTNNILYYNKLYDKEESFNIYYDDYNGYIHFYHMRQNILNGNIQFVEYDHIYNFTGTRKLSSISCDLELVSSASFTDSTILTGSGINEEVLLYSLNRIVSNWDTVYNNGYNAGYTAGQAGENSISPFVNIITTVFTGIDSVLQIEMIPHIKLWYFIAIPLTFVILWGVFKIFKSH